MPRKPRERVAETNIESRTKNNQAAEKITKDNADAVTESGNSSTAAVQELTRAYQELMTKNVRKLTDSMQALAAVKSPTIAIGMTVALNIMMAGALTGANFNPAISLGPMIATANFTNAWLYVIAPIVGALVAALIHKAMKLLAEDGIEVAPRSTAPAE